MGINELTMDDRLYLVHRPSMKGIFLARRIGPSAYYTRGDIEGNLKLLFKAADEHFNMGGDADKFIVIRESDYNRVKRIKFVD